MGTYRTITRQTDNGPYITGLVLAVEEEVKDRDVFAEMFNVHVTRREKDGTILMRRERGSEEAHPSKGYVAVKAACPCDAEGTAQRSGQYIRLTLAEERLNKRIEGGLTESHYILNDYRITQTKDLWPQDAPDPLTGLVFDICTGDICPELSGWESVLVPASSDGEIRLSYGYFAPPHEAGEKLPLIVWLHGAGEGGDDPLVTYTGNRVTALSGPVIQKAMGGAAWVLAPTSPTFWMDDGVEVLGHSNISIYTAPLKACIDAFIEIHREEIDMDRIYVTGISNGGFMTLRMLIDYPGFFAAGVPGCAPFYEENITDEVVNALKGTPLWFVHAKDDPVVSPHETALPLYQRLVAARARNLHFTFWDEVTDPTGEYRDEAGRPRRYVGHAVWILMFDDACRLDFDGTRVMADAEPVTLWEWLGKQKRKED